MKKCPFCAEEIQDEAIVCKHCGRDLKKDVAGPGKRKQPGCLVNILVIIFLMSLPVIGVSLYMDNLDNPHPKAVKQEGPSNAEIYIMAENEAEKRLKAPKTAKFGGFWNADIKRNRDNKYSVYSYVDSQNSFGALIRTYFKVDLEYMGKERWRVLDVQFRNP